MARSKTVRDIRRLRQFVDRIPNACGCMKKRGGKYKANPKCEVCDGTGKVKIRPLR